MNRGKLYHFFTQAKQNLFFQAADLYLADSQDICHLGLGLILKISHIIYLKVLKISQYNSDIKNVFLNYSVFLFGSLIIEYFQNFVNDIL